MAEFDFNIAHRAGSANVIPDVLSRAPLTHPSTTGDDLFFPPPKPVTCFLTFFIGFDIPYLDPSRVSEIFIDALTCLTLVCNPLPLQCLTACSKSHPLRSQSMLSSPLAPPLDKDPLVTPSLPAEPSPQAPNCMDPQALYPLNFSRLSFANKQRQDKCLGPLYHYLVSGCDDSELASLTKSDQSWVKSTAPRCKIIDDLIMYSNVLMDDPTHLRIFIRSDIELQQHLLRAYHDSPIGTHRGCDATYNSLSCDFYW